MTEAHYWRAKLVKDGPWIGVKTWEGPPLVDGEELDRSPRWQVLVRNETSGRALLFGEPCPIECDGVLLRNLERITEADYQYLVDHAAHSTKWKPHEPDASPHKAIDWNSIPPRL